MLLSERNSTDVRSRASMRHNRNLHRSTSCMEPPVLVFCILHPTVGERSVAVLCDVICLTISLVLFRFWVFLWQASVHLPGELRPAHHVHFVLGEDSEARREAHKVPWGRCRHDAVNRHSLFLVSVVVNDTSVSIWLASDHGVSTRKKVKMFRQLFNSFRILSGRPEFGGRSNSSCWRKDGDPRE